MANSHRVLLVTLIVFAAGCPAEDRLLARGIVGPSGGTVAGPGVALGIPPGSLGAMQEISILRSDVQPAGLVELLSPVLQFEPSGLEFAEPAVVNITIPDGTVGRVYWTRPGDDTVFEAVGYASRGRGRARISHFTMGTVAADGCQPAVTRACQCVADDGRGPLCLGLLFPDLPEHCEPGADFVQSGNQDPTGEPCIGWRRKQLCNCARRDNVYMPATGNPNVCQVPYDITGSNPAQTSSWTCPPRGEEYIGWPMGEDRGYYLALDSARRPYNGMTQCDLTNCRQVDDEIYEDRSAEAWTGTLMSCTEQPAEDPATDDTIPPPDPASDDTVPPPDGSANTEAPSPVEAPLAAQDTACCPAAAPPPGMEVELEGNCSCRVSVPGPGNLSFALCSMRPTDPDETRCHPISLETYRGITDQPCSGFKYFSDPATSPCGMSWCELTSTLSVCQPDQPPDVPPPPLPPSNCAQVEGPAPPLGGGPPPPSGDPPPPPPPSPPPGGDPPPPPPPAP